MTEKRVRDLIADANDYAEEFEEAVEAFVNSTPNYGVNTIRIGNTVLVAMGAQESKISTRLEPRQAALLAERLMALAMECEW